MKKKTRDTLAQKSWCTGDSFLFIILEASTANQLPIITGVLTQERAYHILPLYSAQQAAWYDTVSPICDLCDAEDDVQGGQHVNFECTHPLQ
eukprot:scaffold204810_cov17-Tisochrysis_lutea.AAC.1